MEPKICELPNGMSIFYLVRHEVDTFYKEIFDRHLRPLIVSRGMNALWTEGGLLYAPPFR